MTAVAALTGRRRNAACALFGVCATLALPPFFLFPLLIPAFAGLVLMLEAAPTRRRAFFDGWWWGMGFFVTGLYWMCIALLTDPLKFGWLIPFTLLGLNGVIALYPGLASLAFFSLSSSRRKPGSSPSTCRIQAFAGMVKILFFALIWVFFEYLRGHLFTGFPWNLPGYAFAATDASLQAAWWFGVYGLTFLAVLAGAIPASRSKSATALVWLGVALLIGAGAWRLHGAQENYVPDVMLRIVQPGIAQEHKWDRAQQFATMKKLLELSQQPSASGARITHVIWPETAVPFILSADDPALPAILAQAAPEGGAVLTGILRGEGEGEDWQVWNSFAAVDAKGSVAATYDKHKLVPFGEFVPLRRFLPISINKITAGSRDFSPGPGPQSLSVSGLPPLSPLICYEAIFPEEAVNPLEKPGFLLNITNDAWFGTSTGPYQHFDMARMRAVEQGVPLVRAANTGISAVVDAYGRVVAELPLGFSGVLESRLPVALDNRK